MPAISGISFDTMRGLPQSPLSPDQVSDAKTESLAAGLVPPQMPRQDAVEIVTQVTAANLAAAMAVAASCRTLVGTIVTVTVSAGVFISYQFVQEVDVQWKAVKKTSTIYLITATWKLIASYTESDGADNRSLAEVYTAKVFGQWSREWKVRCYGAAEGLGSYAGEADIVQKIGVIGTDNADPVDVVGKWVEIRAKTALGFQTTPVWWGMVNSKSLSRVSSGSEAVFRCVGLVDALRTMYLKRWYEFGASSVVIDPGSILPFNDIAYGNRDKNGANTIGSSSSRYVHDRAFDRTSIGSGHVWRAKDAIQTILSAIEDQYPDGPNWTLTGQTTALNYDFTGNLDGMNVFEQLQALISPARGMTFNVRPVMTGAGSTLKSTAVIQIEVSTVLPSIVNIPGAGIPFPPSAISYPAAYRQYDVDISANNVTDWSVAEDHSDVYDQIFMEGPRPLRMNTVGYNVALDGTSSAAGRGQLISGWSSAQQTAWIAGNEKRRNEQDIAHVYRRFEMKAAWAGNTYTQSAPAAPIGCSRVVNTDGSENGEYKDSGATEWPHGTNIKLTRTLPIPQLAVAADSSSAWASLASQLAAGTLDMSKPKERLHAYMVTSANKWTVLHFEYDVCVTEDRCYITIGRDAADGLKLKAILDQGYDIVFTIGYEFPKTWRVSWKRSPPANTGLLSLQPRDCERTIVLKVNGEGYTRRTMDRDAVISLNGTTPQRVPQTIDVSRPGNIYQALELAKVRYTKPSVKASWTLDGELDLKSDTRPGFLIKKLKVPYARRDSRTIEPFIVLTRRSWNFTTESPSTKYMAEPLLTDINDVTAMPSGANGPVGFGGGAGVGAGGSQKIRP